MAILFIIKCKVVRIFFAVAAFVDVVSSILQVASLQVLNQLYVYLCNIFSKFIIREPIVDFDSLTSWTVYYKFACNDYFIIFVKLRHKWMKEKMEWISERVNKWMNEFPPMFL